MMLCGAVVKRNYRVKRVFMMSVTQQLGYTKNND